MTNNKPSTPPDPRPGLFAALELATSVTRGVDVSQADGRTPCSEFSVADLMGHLVGVFRRIDLIGQRQGASGILPNVADVPLVDTGGELAVLVERIAESWSDDSLLGDILTLPFGQVPGAVAAGMYTSELLTHSWDLAVATGQEVDWPVPLVEGALLGMRMGLPAEPRGDEIPFGEVVPVADDAPAIEGLVAWVGRDPSAW